MDKRTYKKWMSRKRFHIRDYIRKVLPKWLWRLEDLESEARYFAGKRLKEEYERGCDTCKAEKSCGHQYYKHGAIYEVNPRKVICLGRPK